MINLKKFLFDNKTATGQMLNRLVDELFVYLLGLENSVSGTTSSNEISGMLDASGDTKVGDLVYPNTDITLKKAVATSLSATAQGICTYTSGSELRYKTDGNLLVNLRPGLSPAVTNKVFLSDLIAGKGQLTPPTAINTVRQFIGIVTKVITNEKVLLNAHIDYMPEWKEYED